MTEIHSDIKNVPCLFFSYERQAMAFGAAASITALALVHIPSFAKKLSPNKIATIEVVSALIIVGAILKPLIVSAVVKRISVETQLNYDAINQFRLITELYERCSDKEQYDYSLKEHIKKLTRKAKENFTKPTIVIDNNTKTGIHGLRDLRNKHRNTSKPSFNLDARYLAAIIGLATAVDNDKKDIEIRAWRCAACFYEGLYQRPTSVLTLSASLKNNKDYITSGIGTLDPFKFPGEGHRLGK